MRRGNKGMNKFKVPRWKRILWGERNQCCTGQERNNEWWRKGWQWSMELELMHRGGDGTKCGREQGLADHSQAWTTSICPKLHPEEQQITLSDKRVGKERLGVRKGMEEDGIIQEGRTLGVVRHKMPLRMAIVYIEKHSVHGLRLCKVKHRLEI